MFGKGHQIRLCIMTWCCCVEPKSSLIGKRKPMAKKLGAKKGLGGQKINKSFSEIEQQAEQDEKMRQSEFLFTDIFRPFHI